MKRVGGRAMKTKTRPVITHAGDIYDKITERIIELLERGVKPWSPAHFVKVGFPKNFSSRNNYQGINTFLLGMQRYASPWWLTYIQAKDLGGQVKKGERGSVVVKYGKFTKPEDRNKTDGEKPQSCGYLKSYSVFNATQIEGIEFPEPASHPDKIGSQQITAAARIVAAMPDPPSLYEGRFTRAFYSPGADSVDMPSRKFFETETSFYSTLFHELAHSTGHPKRLGRESLTKSEGIKSTNSEARQNYGKEELVAEMAASFLCAHAGILEEEIEQNAAYLQGWIKTLKTKDNRRLIVTAASHAQKAADYVLGRIP
jgi:antirestriction protein ArdC